MDNLTSPWHLDRHLLTSTVAHGLSEPLAAPGVLTGYVDDADGSVKLAEPVTDRHHEFVIVGVASATALWILNPGLNYFDLPVLTKGVTYFQSTTPGQVVNVSPGVPTLSIPVITRLDDNGLLLVRDWRPQDQSPAPTVSYHGTTLPAASQFYGNVFWLQADDGAFAKGLYASDGTQRHRFADVP